ncbi:hypothetical protein L195_g050271 [Trifolium pratense]|uniref:Uncharacterized protein n=1 Tax=Trifolium pratense TaxID=57577 RepID=A0A2K3JT07_TRIPR|nr:hypothetical protein L195_g050271 [Trifolium pratense]
MLRHGHGSHSGCLATVHRRHIWQIALLFSFFMKLYLSPFIALPLLVCGRSGNKINRKGYLVAMYWLNHGGRELFVGSTEMGEDKIDSLRTLEIAF